MLETTYYRNDNLMNPVIYETPLNGAEIAREMDISRQAVSYAIRKSMRKMYQYVLDEKIAETPFSAVLAMMIMLGVNNSDNSDIQQFLKMFDKDIVNKVKEEAESTYNIRK